VAGALGGDGRNRIGVMMGWCNPRISTIHSPLRARALSTPPKRNAMSGWWGREGAITTHLLPHLRHDGADPLASGLQLPSSFPERRTPGKSLVCPCSVGCTFGFVARMPGNAGRDGTRRQDDESFLREVALWLLKHVTPGGHSILLHAALHEQDSIWIFS
jgi:hypothetical protein